MKDKNLPLDYDNRTLEELTDEANKMIKSLEEKDDLDNSVDSYQELLKLNNLIEKKSVSYTHLTLPTKLEV